jgi:hypothetical protein
MMDTTYRLPLNSRVKLRDGIDPALYKGFSCTGNEGWVRHHRADEHGYAQVLIEWDHDHWSYNGAPNCWTWEEHFDLVKGNMPEQPPSENPQEQPTQEDAVRKLVEQFTKGLVGVIAPTPEPEQAADETSDDPEIVEKGTDITAEAIEALQQSKAFIVITVQEKETGGNKLIFPAIYTQSDNEQWALICQGHVGHLFTLMHDSLLQEKLVKTIDAE